MSDKPDGFVETHTEIQMDPMDVIAPEAAPEAEAEATTDNPADHSADAPGDGTNATEGTDATAEAQPEATAEEAAEEQAPEQETAQQKADRLAAFRNQGKLDEERLLRELDGMNGAAQFGREADNILANDVEARVAYLKALKKAGKLPPQGEARLAEDLKVLNAIPAEAEKAPPPPPEKKLPSREEARRTYRKLMAEGREEEAFDFMADWTEAVADQKLRPVTEKLAGSEKRAQEEEARRAQEWRQTEAQKQVNEVREAFPELFDQQGRIADMAVMEKMRELHDGVSAKLPLKKIAELALKDLGRWKAPAKSGGKGLPPQPNRQPMKKSAPLPAVKKSQVEQGYVMTSTPIEGLE